MAKSLKDKFKSLRNRFLIDDAEYRSMCNKLDKHDSELLDKVAEKIREHSGLHYVDCDGYFGGIEELIFKVDDWLDDIIAEMKAEVSKNANES